MKHLGTAATADDIAKQSQLGGGGGGAVMQSATLDLPTATYGHASLMLAAPSCTPSSLVIAQLLPNADWDADELEDVRLQAEPEAGAIEFVLSRNGPMVGNFKVAYLLA